MEIAMSVIGAVAILGLVVYTTILHNNIKSLAERCEAYRDNNNKWRQVQEKANMATIEFIVAQDKANQEAAKLFTQIITTIATPPSQKNNSRIFESDN